MSDLPNRLKALEADLLAEPMRHFTYADLPFAVFSYPPDEEWTMRRELRMLETRLQNRGGFTVHRISLADLLWRAVEESEGLEEVVALERRRGYAEAQKQVALYLMHKDFRPLPELVAEELAAATSGPGRHLVFIVRTGALAPVFYKVSILLDQLKGKTDVPCVLFMPATGDALGLRFMGVAENEGRGSYHTKVYMD